MRRTRSYHHGNLRETLLKAAVDLIATAGPRGFTLRAIARRAGVSHNAPYRHFRDRGALFGAVATQGFRELTRAMLEAAEGQATALDRLRRAGLAYVEFALRRPEHFTVMFDAPIPTTADPEGEAAARQAFGTLLDLIQQCQRDGLWPREDPLRRALVAWSLVHGIAKLAIAKRLPFSSAADVQAFAAWALDEPLPSAARVGGGRKTGAKSGPSTRRAS